MGLFSLFSVRSTEIYWEGVAGGNVPLRFSLACLGFSFLFRGVQRGCFSFQRERAKSERRRAADPAQWTSVAEGHSRLSIADQ